MDVGINLPVMAPGLDRGHLLAWCARVDAGPWSSLAAGDRVNYPNPELHTLLAAAAIATERVRLVTNVTVVPIHHPVALAKQLATIDVLSAGRLVVGVGVGGREEDVLAVDAPTGGAVLDRLEQGVARMRALWSGAHAHPDALRPVEPFPVQDPVPVLAGSLGPRSIARAARWADGLLSFSFGMAGPEVAAALEAMRGAWADAGRDGAPRLVTGGFVAVGPDPDRQMEAFLRRYLNFLGPAAEHALPVADLRSPTAVRAAVDRVRDLGADEVLLTPTTVDPDEVDRLADAVFG